LQRLSNATLRKSALVAGATLAIITAALWLIDRSANVYSADARVRAAMIIVSSDVAGRIAALPVAVGDSITATQPLARLDDRDACLALASLSLDLEAVEAEIGRERLRARLAKKAGAGRVSSRQSGLAAATADQSAAAAMLATAQAEFDRAKRLRASDLMTQSTFERASANLDSARQISLRTAAAIGQQRASISEAKAEAGEADVIAHTIDVLTLRADSLRQQVARAKVQIRRHTIASPLAGVVDEVFVDPGEYVQPGARIALLHDPAQFWIDANIKETEIDRVAPGAPVRITFDALPGRAFAGRVAHVRAAAASEFALIPNANPSGVFTKITQRVPVRIVVEGDLPILRPGAMATVKIRARKKSDKRHAG